MGPKGSYFLDVAKVGLCGRWENIKKHGVSSHFKLREIFGYFLGT